MPDYGSKQGSEYDPQSEKGYFANLTGREMAAAIWQRFHDGQAHLRASDRHGRILRSWQMYFARNRAEDTTQVGQAGKQGELTTIHPNHYRNLTQHVLSMITGTPDSRRAEAINSDTESMAHAMLANGIVEYYASDRKVGERIHEMLERTLVMTEAWIGAPWDPNSGEEYGVDETEDPDNPDETIKRRVYTGDFAFPVLTPYEVVQAAHSEDPDEPEWGIYRRRINKYKLAALYPEHEEDILKQEPHSAMFQEANFGKRAKYDDLIPVLEFYHTRGPHVLSGRQVFVISPKTAIFDGDLGYKRIPYFRCAAADIIHDDGGYSANLDMLPVCEAINGMHTTLLSNNVAFGTQMLGIPKGSGLTREDIGPLRILHYAPGMKPEAIQLTASAPESYGYLDKLESTAQKFSGVTDAQRGDASASKGDSGAKSALMTSMAQQFQGPLAKALARTEEALFTHLVDTIKTRVETPRIAAIAGDFNTSMARSYVGKDIDRVVKVRVKTGDPSLGTVEGRRRLLEQIMALPGAPTFINAQQLILFMETGRIEPMTESATAELMLIRGENELFGKEGGADVHVAPYDQHRLHWAEHQVKANDPDARKNNPQLIADLSAHMLWHLACLTPGSKDPKNGKERFVGFEVLKISGQEPIMLGPPGAPAGGGAPPGGPSAKPPPSGNGEMPALPSMPKSALDGEQMDANLPPPGNQAST